MIYELTGRVRSVTPDAAVLDAPPLAYEVLVPGSAAADLQRLIGNEVRLFTLFFLDGSLATGSLVPRLVGFLSEAERAFFHLLCRVKGISTRKALRAMSVPVHQIASAVEHGDERMLTTLPEIGKRTAALMVTELRGKLQAFIAPTARPTPEAALTDAQQVAVEILVQWGDKRADAVRWVASAVVAEPGLAQAEDIVRAAYRVKQGKG